MNPRESRMWILLGKAMTLLTAHGYAELAEELETTIKEIVT